MTRSRTANRQATVAPATYSAPEGWEVGNAAPEDRYVEVAPDGSYIGEPSKTPPKGKYARQVAVKGDIVTDAMRDTLGLNADEGDDGSGDDA